MDKNAFQTEMNRVAFTPAGREALTEALMEGAPARRSMGWAKRGLAAALAAVVLAGSALRRGRCGSAISGGWMKPSRRSSGP